jgi:ParB-like chromosome segregation protein Spo0J
MDAENRVDGEDGQRDTPEGEAPQAPAPEAGAPAEGQSGGGQSAASGEAGGAPEVSGAPEASAAPEGGAAPEASAAPEGGGEARAEPPAPEAAAAKPDIGVEGEVRRLNHTRIMHLPLEQLVDDATFRLREEGDVSALATDVARLGQLFPVDVRPVGPDRYQLLCGFRRVEALRFLKRDRVLARIHVRMSDEDALLLSLAEAIHSTSVDLEELAAKKEQLEAEGRLSAAVRDMLEKALETEEGLAPEGVEEEVDADELAQDVTQRLGDINQDLSLLADVFTSLDEARRAELLTQLRYSADLVAYLEGL